MAKLPVVRDQMDKHVATLRPEDNILDAVGLLLEKRVTGAPVVPVVMFGTRAPGARSSSLPPRFGVVDLVYGRPWHVDAEPWPRTHQRLVEASASLRAHMLECLAEGERLTGRSMPGPLPAGDKEYAVPGQTSEWESHD